MEFSMEKVLALGIDLRAGLEYTGGNDKYASALQRYYMTSDKNKAKIKESLSLGDLESFVITVHSLKSNSKMIGALSLSSKFEVLEIAGKNKDVSGIQQNIRAALDEYETLLEVLKPLGEVAEYKAPGEISGEEAKKVADSLLEALDDYDDEKAGELAKKLAGYPFRITQKGKLKEATEKINDFMYEEAADLIREIITAIE